ncbi:MAG TPA: sulfatase-like hydrolase/transferase [Myxococcota bacterium]|nr:sulfatase-like hydrolase/transferase [Myxococcota bacterium]
MSRPLSVALLLVPALLAGCKLPWGGAREPAAKEKKAADARPEGGRRPVDEIPRDKPETVVFIVMDTVRADHLSLCGYDRPTSPFLEHLRDDLGVAVTCSAYSPATWTMPSHTSYFTGKDLPEHGHDRLGGKLPDGAGPFLSELMHTSGHESMMFAANTALKKSGLQVGFDRVRIAEDMLELRAGPFEGELEAFLEGAPKDKPWFLFVNLIDAHDPYPEIPEDAGWVPAQNSLPLNIHDKEEDTAYHEFLKGSMPAEKAERYLTAIRNGYDYGVSQEDANIRSVFHVLRKLGRLPGPLRLVITADHGEFIGEHGLLRHAAYTWEPVVKVPFLYFDNLKATQPALPEPMSATTSFYLLRDGALPEPALPALSWSRVMDERPIKPGEDMMARWTPGAPKLLWTNGKIAAFDLSKDPGEEHPGDPAGHPTLPEFQTQADRYKAHLDSTRDLPLDAETVEALRKLGYLH